MINHKNHNVQRLHKASSRPVRSKPKYWLCGVAFGAIAVWLASPAVANAFEFTTGDLVVSVEGDGSNTASGGTSATGNTGADADTYIDNQAAPLTLDEFTTTGTNQTNPVATLELPQTAFTTSLGTNSPISGEYGSSSEAGLQLSSNGQYLTIMGYGTNAASYNQNYDVNGASLLPTPTGTALAQSCSMSSGCGGTPQESRVIALIGANGGVNTTTVLNNVFNENNPRSVYANVASSSSTSASFYISGQGSGNANDLTGGVFYVPGIGPNQTAVPITGTDATSTGNPPNNIGQDTRFVTEYDNTLYVSTDTKEGTGSARDFIGTLGSPPATSLYNNASGPTQLTGFGTTKTGVMTITTGVNSNGNQFNDTATKNQINLSPADFFFADATTLYVADTGSPKNDKAGDTSTSKTNIGDGGLQKWSLVGYTLVNGSPVGGTWQLDYTLTSGLLDFVQNDATSGTTGLLGLTGEVVGDEVDLFATNYTIGDTDQTYLYSITDMLSDDLASEAADESFTVLATAPADTNFKGVSFAPLDEAAPLTPTPLPASWTFLLIGLAGFGFIATRRRTNGSGLAAA